MKIVIAPQAFKGSFSSIEVAHAIEAGALKAHPNAKIILLPISDGGDGFLETILTIQNGDEKQSEVMGPLGNNMITKWGITHNPTTAVIELAKICGLNLIPKESRNPKLTTTYGIGQIIKEALDMGIRNFLIGLGGSATNDAGTGLVSALGAKFIDENGQKLPLGGSHLVNLHSIDLSNLDPRIKESTIVVGCDVTNPLTGPSGATSVYAPQKGATPEMVDLLENSLKHFAEVAHQDLKNIPFAGAAGGTAAGLHIFLGAHLKSGIDLVLDELNFNDKIRDADLIITGEGRMDAQTLYNKGPIGVAHRAKAQNIPVLAIVGSVGPGYEAVHAEGITHVIPLSSNKESTLDQIQTAIQNHLSK